MILGIENVDIFKVFFDVVYEYKETVELIANETGVKISLLDRSHTCFYEVFYNKDFFDVFEVDGAEVISVFIEDLYKIIKTNKAEYLLISSDDNYVTMKFEKNGNSRIFEIVQTTEYVDTPQMPSLDVNTEFMMSVDAFNQTLTDAEILNSHSLRIVTNENNVVLGVDENAQAKYNHIVDVATDGTADSKYSLNFVKDLGKFKKVSNTIDINYDTDMPLCWSVIGDNISISGLIAPLLNEGDE